MEILNSNEAELKSKDEQCILPRKSPLVGFLRHSPPLQLPSTKGRPTEAMYDNFDQLLQWRSHHESDCCVNFVPGGPGVKQQTLDKKSPYVGSHRHAPPSPVLNFTTRMNSFELPPPLLLVEEALRQVPEEAGFQILSFIVEVKGIPCLARVNRGFSALMKSELVWARRSVHIAPGMVPGLAPHLAMWLPAWRLASKIVIPRSQQLIAELAREAPDLPVEFAWRFDRELKGIGVEVIHHGRSVKRVAGADEELVVLGDAPLFQTVPENPYLEVVFDDRSIDVAKDDLNDFGIGVTAQPPTAIEELGSVAGEVPLSWVVDFTRSSVVLSVNNMEAAKGCGVSAKDIHQGSRVGLRVTAIGTFEIYLDGLLRESLAPNECERVPPGVHLFPVLDLYGCTAQLSRTYAERPTPDECNSR